MRKSKIIILFVYLIILVLTLCGCGNGQNDSDINKKLQSEIQYLDKKIIGIMNKLNNITLENYEVKSKEIKSESNKQNESSQNSESSEDKSSQEGSGSEGQKEENSESGQKTDSIKVLQMQPSNILVINKDEIDWNTIKSEIELMYSTWNSILLDLYNLDIENENILGFSQELDNVVLAAKLEDKQKTLETLANIYSYLPKYMDKISTEESAKNILQTKANVMKAYALIEQENWDEVQNQINLADNAYAKVTNDVQYIENKQGEVSKVYVLIKELKNSINVKDKDIFYIKYKNLMNSID